MRRFTLLDRVRYRFDNSMAHGTRALVAWLFFASGVLVVVASLAVWIAGVGPKGEDGSSTSLPTLLWMSLLRTLDPGTMSSDAGHPAFLAAMLGVTLGGIFVVSAFIGVVNAGIEGKIEQLRKGRSFVVEHDHTLVLGWAPPVFSVLEQIALANGPRGGGCVVILAEEDKVAMEEAIRDKRLQLGKTRVVCRTASPIDPHDLEIGNPGGARAIVVLAPEEDQPDAHVIKTLLALMHEHTPESARYRIVAELHDPRNRDAAELVGKGHARLVMIEELISRVMVQTCRQSGLSAVYMELLGFDGNDLHVEAQPALVGKTFGDALFAFERGALVGVRRGDRTMLAPAMDLTIEKDDLAIVIGMNDAPPKATKRGRGEIEEDAIVAPTVDELAPEKVLLLGWSARCPAMLAELAKYVAPGTRVVIAGESLEAAAIASRANDGRLVVEHRVCDPTDRHALDALDVPSFDHVVTVSASEIEGSHEADAHTLVTLLHLRDIKERSGGAFSITSEMLDVRNRELAQITEADDFIVSHALGSLVLAQIAENPFVADVFDDLFDAEGAEIYLRPARDYVELDREIAFETLVECGRRRGECVIGVREKRASAVPPRYGVLLSPSTRATIKLAESDRVIVVAVRPG